MFSFGIEGFGVDRGGKPAPLYFKEYIYIYIHIYIYTYIYIYIYIYICVHTFSVMLYFGRSKCEASAGHGVILYQSGCSKGFQQRCCFQNRSGGQ